MDWLALKTDPALLEALRNAPAMSTSQIFEQRVSYVLSCVPDLTREQVRKSLIRLGFGPL